MNQEEANELRAEIIKLVDSAVDLHAAMVMQTDKRPAFERNVKAGMNISRILNKHTHSPLKRFANSVWFYAILWGLSTAVVMQLQGW